MFAALAVAALSVTPGPTMAFGDGGAQVEPTNVSLPFLPPVVQCGGVHSLEASFVNPTSVDAVNASATVALPADWVFFKSAATKAVAGGTLQAGATSASRSWSIAPRYPGGGSATVTGNASNATSDTVTAALPSCELWPAAFAKQRVRDGSNEVDVSGRVKPDRSGFQVGVGHGQVRLTFARPAKPPVVKMASLHDIPNNTFAARISACQPGLYSVTARYLGSIAYAATDDVTLGSVEVSRRC
jgi:hypothetical protein